MGEKIKRVEVKFDQDTYDKLVEVAKSLGFTTPSRLLRTLSFIVVGKARHRKRLRLTTDYTTNGEYIDQMFREFSNYEQQPDGEGYVLRREREYEP